MDKPKPGGLLLALASHTVRLLECNDQNRPCGKLGSGFLWHRGDKLHLITVAHVFQNAQHHVCIEAGLRTNGLTIMIEVCNPGWVRVCTAPDTLKARSFANMVANARDIDFAWATYDTNSLRATLREGIQKQTIHENLNIIRHDLNVGISSRARYNFAARLPTNYHDGTGCFDWKEVVEVGMTYDGTETTGPHEGMYRFRLNRPHQGDAYYRGSSGAPIADDDGNPVAVMACAGGQANIICGCPLQPYVQLIDLPCRDD